MKILFRTDASIEIGTGHVMRCLTLAIALKANGFESHFICKLVDGHIEDVIVKRGFSVSMMDLKGEQDELWREDVRFVQNIVNSFRPEWIVVDHYGLDERWETSFANDIRILTIDDITDRPHACDLLLNQNLDMTETDYSHLVPAKTKFMLGVDFALLRPEFAAIRDDCLADREQKTTVNNILISMGGVDEPNATGWIIGVMTQLNELMKNVKLTIVLGNSSPHIDLINRLANEMSIETELLVGTNEMEVLMKNADISIGAAGSTSWERCCLGLPTILVVIADNQIKIASALEQARAAVICEIFNDAELLAGLKTILTRENVRATMTENSAQICDGMGAQRVMGRMLQFVNLEN